MSQPYFSWQEPEDLESAARENKAVTASSGAVNNATDSPSRGLPNNPVAADLAEARRLATMFLFAETSNPEVHRLARAFQELDAEYERLKKELNFSKNCTGVVVRPTQAMMEAGAKALADYICRKVPGNDNTAACAVYAAMLAAQERK